MLPRSEPLAPRPADLASKIHRSAFIERAGRLAPGRLEQVTAGRGRILGR